MNSRSVESKSASCGNQNPSNAEGGHDCINMILEANVVTWEEYYGFVISQNKFILIV